MDDLLYQILHWTLSLPLLQRNGPFHQLLYWALHVPLVQRNSARLFLVKRWRTLQDRYHTALRRVIKLHEKQAFKPAPVLRYDEPYEKLTSKEELCPHSVIHYLLKL